MTVVTVVTHATVVTNVFSSFQKSKSKSKNVRIPSIELVNQGKRVLWDLLWLLDFRGLTRQSSLHLED
jgi:hypothetical protein